MLDGVSIHGMAMGMLLTCTVCFATTIGETHMTRECLFCMNSVVAVVLRSWSWRYACHASSVFRQW